MLISVDFWKSMHGFAMDSRTRVRISSVRTSLVERSYVGISTFRSCIKVGRL